MIDLNTPIKPGENSLVCPDCHFAHLAEYANSYFPERTVLRCPYCGYEKNIDADERVPVFEVRRSTSSF
jgi:hypothetical protein